MDIWFRVTSATEIDFVTGKREVCYRLERCVSEGGVSKAHVLRAYDKDSYPRAARAAFEKNSQLHYARNLSAQPGG